MGLSIEVGDFVVYEGTRDILYYAIVDRVDGDLVYGRWTPNESRVRQKGGTYVCLAVENMRILEKASINLEEILWD